MEMSGAGAAESSVADWPAFVFLVLVATVDGVSGMGGAVAGFSGLVFGVDGASIRAVEPPAPDWSEPVRGSKAASGSIGGKSSGAISRAASFATSPLASLGPFTGAEAGGPLVPVIDGGCVDGYGAG